MITKKETADEIYQNKVFLARGKRGFVYFSEYKGKKYIIKEKNPDSTAERTIENESEFNIKLNEIGVGPKFYYQDPKNMFLIREFIEGINIYEWTKKQLENKTELKLIQDKLKKILLDILAQAYEMDKARINKQEMTRPHKDILITNDNEPVIIDFERCRISEKAKNVTQFCQFLANGKFNFELKDLGMEVDSKKLLELASKYKNEDYSEEVLEKIEVEIKKF